MKMSREIKRLVAGSLCWSLLIPFAPQPAEALKPSEIVIVEAGQPAVWSLGQAHYLLANMHKRNLDLSTRLPSEDDLDPNRINASRLEALRTALSVEAQFDQSIGVGNDLERNRFRNEQGRQEQAREALTQRRADLAVLDSELLTLNEELAVLQEQDRQRNAARAATTPPTPPSEADNARKVRIELLKVRKTQKETERTRLESEISSLNTAATTNPTAPNLQTVELGTGGGLPSSQTFDAFMKKALDDFGRPSLAPSIALDNFVGMQYEIISKQLTLLRDEVGPGERVIFLELPSSIYTVASKADDYVAQVEWEVTRYWEVPSEEKELQEVSRRALKDQGKDVEYYGCPNDSQDEQNDKSFEDYASKVDCQILPFTLEMIRKFGKQKEAVNSDGDVLVRALDIIPRQSALNVNEHHATVRYMGILGGLRWLSGFGAQLNFQRQKELYEQFIQQEIFASGYGKGTNSFGWTFGALPGSKRLAPGQRTTYAVLAVPRDTAALELTPKTRAFKRKAVPGDKDVMPSFMVGVPGAQIDGFYVDRVSYTPVTKGKRAAVILEGSNFSPQTGVLVNGTPLKKAISITRAGSKEAPATLATGIEGEYELTNSKQIVLSFGMGSDYVGTPLITLVTPGKSSAINFFNLEINNRPRAPRNEPRQTLDWVSAFEPMFIDDFSPNAELEEIDRYSVAGSEFVAARLQGRGLRPGALINVNDRLLKRLPFGTRMRVIQSKYGRAEEFSAQESTGAYVVYFKKPGDECTVRYQQATRQGFDGTKITHVLNVPFSHKIRNYRRGFRGGPAEVDLTFTSKDATVQRIRLSDGLQSARPAVSGGCLNFELEGTNKYRVRCMIPPLDGRVERDFVSVRLDRSAGVKFVDISLPGRPGGRHGDEPAHGQRQRVRGRAARGGHRGSQPAERHDRILRRAGGQARVAWRCGVDRGQGAEGGGHPARPVDRRPRALPDEHRRRREGPQRRFLHLFRPAPGAGDRRLALLSTGSVPADRGAEAVEVAGSVGIFEEDGAMEEKAPYRRLRVYTFDPSLDTQLDTSLINETVLRVPWERLGKGPVGDYLEVVDYDPASECFYEPVDLDAPHLLAQDGLAPSEGNPKFHQQMVYAVAMTTIRHFERALGRKALWAPDYKRDPQTNEILSSDPVPKLRVYPHALREANAYYSPEKKALLFGYFPAVLANPGENLPGGLVFTCLSHDVIAHETTHALLDGLHRYFAEPSNPDVLAFHEAFADIVALFQHFTQAEALRHQITKTRGDLASQNMLGELARQFGQAIGNHGALRDAIGRYEQGKWKPQEPDPEQFQKTTEPHARGAILVAAMFDAFIAIYKSRIADLLRIATGGTGRLPEGDLHPDLVSRLAREATKAAGHMLRMAIRALDYCPPVDITFGDYLRALVTSDWDVSTEDERGYRIAVIEAFRRRGIYPRDVRTLAADALRWQKPAEDMLPDFAELIHKLKMQNSDKRTTLEWQTTGTREEIGKLNDDYQYQTWDWVRKKLLDLDTGRARNRKMAEKLGWNLGLSLEHDALPTIFRGLGGLPSLEVHSVRSARRLHEGRMIIDLVVELVQRRRGYLDPDVQSKAETLKPHGKEWQTDEYRRHDFTFRGGCTLLINSETGEVRYSIAKNICGASRLERQREFAAASELSLRATYSPVRKGRRVAEPFALLHRAY